MAINSDFESCIPIHGNMATDISSTATSIDERQINIHHLKKKLFFLPRTHVEFSNKIRWNPIPILVGLIVWPSTNVEFSSKIPWNDNALGIPFPSLRAGKKTSDRGNLRGKFPSL